MEVYKKEVNGQTVNYQEITTETVVANPTAEGTEQLEKLQVGNTVYNMPEGGGGETFKTKLTTVFTATETELSESDALLFGTITRNFNLTPVTQVIFNVKNEYGVDHVGFLQNINFDITAGTLTVTYKSVFYKLTLIGNINTNTITGKLGLNEETTSGGGLTKTKVTLAELQTMMTTDNLGTIVSYNFKVFPPTLSQISEGVTPALLFSGVGDGVTTIKQLIDTSTQIYISNSHFAFVLNKMIAVTLTISSELISGELLFDNAAYTIQEQYLTDEYFDFYIYK